MAFDIADLERFLKCLDGHLEVQARLVLIGGSALALAYRVVRVTRDVDTFETDNIPMIKAAAERARADTGLDIPLSDTPVADVPYFYAERLVPVLPSLERLKLFALEKHDLALSKIVRCSEGDLEGLGLLHKTDPLDLMILVDRFIAEMRFAIGNPRSHAENLLHAVRRLFGEIAAEEVAERAEIRARLLKAD